MLIADTYVSETGTVFGDDVDWNDKKRDPPNYDPDFKNTANLHFSGGDHIEDMKAWMRLGKGERLPDL